MSQNEARVLELGRELLERIGDARPTMFGKGWQAKMLEWTMDDEDFKVEMFRFVDVFPVLNDTNQVIEHLKAYFGRPEQSFGKAIRWGLAAATSTGMSGRLAAGQIERNLRNMARTFIAGTDAHDAVAVLKKLRSKGLGFTLDLLGEACVSEAEGEEYQRRYLEVVDALAERTAAWPEDPRIDGARFPRVNLSIKPSSLYSLMDAADLEGSVEATKDRLRPIFMKAKEHGAFLNIDMESRSHKEITIEAFKGLLEEDELRETPGAGIVLQSYLVDAEKDLDDLLDWAKRRERPIAVRLVKGAYWDYEVVASLENGWPIPVYVDKNKTDAAFERMVTRLLEAAPLVLPAIASHNARSVAHCLSEAERLKLTRDDFELQTLFGMAEPFKEALVNLGWRVREYVPIGELIPGMAYLVRRLLENSSNTSWLRQRYAEAKDPAELLADPAAKADEPARFPDPTEGAPAAGSLGPFDNEPQADFSVPEVRARFKAGIVKARETYGGHSPLVINGERVDTNERLESLDPAAPERVVGTCASATPEHGVAAVDAALDAFPAWRDTSAEVRAAVLVRAAAIMRERIHDLSGLIVCEVGKPWRDAYGDVGEAIDFLEYYARLAVGLGSPQRLGYHPGELNHLLYEPRGLAAVIAPWNFPLAILTGMTSAALVTGNCVLMKPAEQSPVIAARLMDILLEAGAPAGTVHYLPGRGEVIGAWLVDHPQIETIAFTGSMEVGLHIWQQAGRTRTGQMQLKKVICEMGGKNALIVDGDADLDEAVSGVVKSAFNFQGQKCSACSRVVVLSNQYDTFVRRLTESTRTLPVGPPVDPRFRLGPVVDEEAHERILKTIEEGKEQGKIAAQTATREDGYYVPATVFVDVAPDAPIATEEIFGPVLSVLRADSFEQATEIACNSRYALTGGVFSRNPLHIEYARKHFRVGNLYINRGTTGALVWRQPFGGFRRSGAGTKAGGPDYLLNFLQPRAVCENTVRRGFAPVVK